jgi:hypothetical protein
MIIAMSLFNGPINNITFINTNHNILLQLLRKKIVKIVVSLLL